MNALQFVSEDLAQGIRDQLRKSPRKTVQRFLESLDAALENQEFLKIYADEARRRRQINRLLKACIRFLHVYDEEVYQASKPNRTAHIFHPKVKQHRVGEKKMPSRDELLEGAQVMGVMFNAGDTVRDFLGALEKLREDLEIRSSGRPEADRFGLVAYISRRYEELFDHPATLTPGKPFANVLALILKSKDVSRQIKAARKQASKRKNLT